MHAMRTIAILAALMLACIARAGDVRFVPPAAETWEGIPVRILVEVSNAADVQAPLGPKVDGAQVRVVERGRQSRTEVRNGRVSSSTTVTWAVEVTPDAPGTLSIPPISVTADGVERSSPAFTVAVRRSDAGDLLSAEIYGSPPEVYVGQPLDLVLRIVIKPYRDPNYGQLNETQMWGLVDVQGSEWGPFEPEVADLVRRSAVPRSHQESRDGTTWFVYELKSRTWPPKAGSGVPDLKPVKVAMTYPIALRETQSFFLERQLTISDARPLSVRAEATGIRVLPVPDEGRPASFTGAVGEFRLDVQAKPVDVEVGQPVTLTLTLQDASGRANLESVLPPALAANAELTKDFRVPTDALSGEVSGNAKRFTVTVRPTRAGIEAIPPIEFSSFDPATKTFRTVRSAPIPVSVRPASRMDLAKIVGGGTAGTDTSPTAGATQLTAIEDGLVANKPVSPVMLARAPVGVDALSIAGLALPPLAAAGALAWRIRRDRHARDGGLARRSRAGRRARERLRAAEDAAGIAAAVTGLVEDALGRPEGTLTRGDMDAALAASGASAELRRRVAEVLARCDRARYAGSAGGPDADLRTEGAALVDALDAAGFARARRPSP